MNEQEDKDLDVEKEWGMKGSAFFMPIAWS